MFNTPNFGFQSGPGTPGGPCERPGGPQLNVKNLMDPHFFFLIFNINLGYCKKYIYFVSSSYIPGM